MRHDAVGQPACPDQPPVVDDAGDQAYVPVGAVLSGEEDGRHPEGVGRIGSEPHGLKVLRTYEPAHQPATPEELLEDRHERHGAKDAKGYEDGIVPEIRRCGAPRGSDKGIVEEPVTSVRWPEQVGSNPENEHADAHQDAPGPGARAEGDQTSRADQENRAHHDHARGVEKAWRDREPVRQRDEDHERRKGRDVWHSGMLDDRMALVCLGRVKNATPTATPIVEQPEWPAPPGGDGTG